MIWACIDGQIGTQFCRSCSHVDQPHTAAIGCSLGIESLPVVAHLKIHFIFIAFYGYPDRDRLCVFQGVVERFKRDTVQFFTDWIGSAGQLIGDQAGIHAGAFFHRVEAMLQRHHQPLFFQNRRTQLKDHQAHILERLVDNFPHPR